MVEKMDETASKLKETELVLAVFVDVQQINADTSLIKVFDHLDEKGYISIRIAYAEWKTVNENFKQELIRLDFELIEVPSATFAGKNGADMRLTIDVMKFLQSRPDIDIYIIMAGDSDYSQVAKEIRKSGHQVIMIGNEGKVSKLIKTSPGIEFFSLESFIRKPEHVENETLSNDSSIEINSSGTNDLEKIRIENDLGSLELTAEQWLDVLGVIEDRCKPGACMFVDVLAIIKSLIYKKVFCFAPQIVVPLVNTFIHFGLFIQPSKGMIEKASDYDCRRDDFIKRFNLA